MTNARKLTIFVHRASECLTDHESHGEGLICFSLLRGLAERGHQIYAYTNRASIREMPPRMVVKSERHRIPANSLAPWEYALRADRWLQKLAISEPIDLVWYMNPVGGSPRPPKTLGRPLVVGPLYYAWPDPLGGTSKSGRPRLGIGLQSIVRPIAERGWEQTLSAASLIFCSTGPHTELVQQQHPAASVRELPVIVDPPPGTKARAAHTDSDTKNVTLLFVANLVKYKNPMIFCETIQRLRAAGIDATGTLLGDGSERPVLEAYCAAQGLKNAVCFRGKVPNSAVYEALSEADFLVSTSVGEPYGRGIAEAMSVGTPAACHHSGGPADFICDGINGLLVDSLTADAYAARLQSAMSNPNAWNMLSGSARQKAEHWCTDVVLDALETQLYRTLSHSSLNVTHTIS